VKKICVLAFSGFGRYGRYIRHRRYRGYKGYEELKDFNIMISVFVTAFLVQLVAQSTSASLMGAGRGRATYDNLVFTEDFSKGLDFSIWKHEIVSVYGTTSLTIHS
jgi:hypothetical protein